MKKIIIALQVSVGIFLISTTAFAQTDGDSKVVVLKQIPPVKNLAPTTTIDTKNILVKPELSLQAKPTTNSVANAISQNDDALPTPIAMPKNLSKSVPQSTIDTKLNTEKYYTKKPILPPQIISEKTNQPIIVKPIIKKANLVE